MPVIGGLESVDFAILGPSILASNVGTSLGCDLVGLSTDPASAFFMAWKEARFTSGFEAAVNDIPDNFLGSFVETLDLVDGIDPLFDTKKAMLEGAFYDLFGGGMWGILNLHLQVLAPVEEVVDHLGFLSATLLLQSINKLTYLLEAGLGLVNVVGGFDHGGRIMLGRLFL